jgi:hypothetical protein
MNRRIVATACAALLLASCGGDDGGDGDAVDDPRTAAELVADQAAADAAQMVLDDFPTGWEAEPRDDDDEDDEEEQAKLAECLGIDAALLDAAATHSKSDTFTSDDLEVEVNISVQPTLDLATEAMGALSTPETLECYRTSLQQVFDDLMSEPEGEQGRPDAVGAITVESLAVGELGDQSFAFRVTVPITLDDQTADIYFDIVGVRSGRATASINFQSVVLPFDEDLQRELAQTLADRLPSDAP